MAFVNIKHERSGVYTDISDSLSILTIKRGTGSKKNTMKVTLSNTNFKLNEINFQLDDDIIAFITDDGDISGTPTMIGAISKVDYVTDSSGDKIVLNCVDKTFLLLSKLWAKAYTPSNPLTTPEVIINVIDNTTEDNLGGSRITTDNVSLVKSDGIAFSNTVSLSKVWRPVYEWIEELSAPENTGEDRTYVFYVDENNDLHWEYPSQKNEVILSSAITSSQSTITVDTTLSYPSKGVIQIENESIFYDGITSTTFTNCDRGINGTIAEGHDAGEIVYPEILIEGKAGVESISISRDNDGTYNFIIYNAGITPADFELLWYKFDDSSAEKEFRMTKINWKDVGQGLIDKEKSRSDWTSTDNYPASYPWTPHWRSSSVANDSEYQAAFIVEQKRLGDAKAQASFRSVGDSKVSATVFMTGNLNYIPGDKLSILSRKNNVLASLRIEDIQHQISNKGFFTTLTLKEDEI